MDVLCGWSPGLAGVIALVTPGRRRGGERHRREKEWFLEGMGHTHISLLSNSFHE